MKGLLGGKKKTSAKSPVKASLSYHEAEKLWITHPDNVWVLADVLSLDHDEGTAIVKSEFGESTVELKDCHIFHHTHSADLNNLCLMNNFHEAPLLNALRERSQQQMIYTDIGNVLISVNPYETIEGLYDSPLDYFSYDGADTTALTTLPPHIYFIANTALCSMLKNTAMSCLTKNTNQSLVISGESGAGKTEASKKVVRFLIECDLHMSPLPAGAGSSREHRRSSLELAPALSPNEIELQDKDKEERQGQEGEEDRELSGGASPSEGQAELISRRILESTFIFESFGNAKTVRNDNSSRFGKFIKLQYGTDKRLCGAHVDTFLLEQSRLAHVSLGERNYHIFYQMLRGEHHSLDKYLLDLSSPEEYKILLGAGSERMVGYPDEERDAAEFSSLCTALQTLGCSEDDLVNVWRVLAAILHMGNCYTATQSVDGPSEHIPLNVHCSSTTMEFIAQTFGVPLSELHQALTIRVIRAYKRSSFSSKMLSAEEVMFNLYAVIKYLYSALFRWLQTTVNNAFKAVDNADIESFIGILDIFGFEIMETNSFEQLCINYTNELLQKLFNETIFTTEQEAYAAEGIQWQQLDFQDNQEIIDLLAQKPSGLFPTIDAQGMLNRRSGGDKGLVAAFSKAHLKNPKDPNALYSESKFGSGEAFVIRHFAGTVEYAVEGFLDKNNSSLQEDLMEVLRFSSKPFVREVFRLDVEEEEEGDEATKKGLVSKVTTRIKRMSSGGTHKKPNKLAATNTVSGQFMEQLDSLLASLRETRTHYVKCIKPNTSKSPRLFDAPLVMQQLQCNGIMELVRIKRQGYPTHSEFRDFYTVFQFFSLGKTWESPQSCSDEQAREYTTLIAEFALPSNMFQVGHNMIFLRDGFEVLMRDAKIRVLTSMATRLQTAFRRHRDRRSFLRKRQCAVLIQSVFRSLYWTKLYAKAVSSVVIIQKYARRRRVRKLYLRRLRAAGVIQTYSHRLLAQRRLRAAQKSVTTIASAYRMRRCKVAFSRQRSFSIVLQCAYRCSLARRALRSRKIAFLARSVQLKRERDLRELRASILISAFFKSVRRNGGREKARGKIAPPVSTRGIIITSLCKRYINTLRKKRKISQ